LKAWWSEIRFLSRYLAWFHVFGAGDDCFIFFYFSFQSETIIARQLNNIHNII